VDADFGRQAQAIHNVLGKAHGSLAGKLLRVHRPPAEQ
jgi:hypothetical protein